MIYSVFLSLYFTCLISFSFVSHPVVYCVLLLVSAMSVSGLIYLVMGVSWYLALFSLVYVGGVYVLFIFVSVHSPNPVSLVGVGVSVFVILFLSFFCLFSLPLGGFPVVSESSHFLCSYFEGFSYCLFCLVLMVGFVSISSVVGGSDSFYR
uniref:NADH dehydrogenase subunit 6 n=1 Tax=Acanthoparyphium sp. WAK-2018 TaxID=2185117 RepID=A0A2S1YEK1_9TREM|nr:NADH dehydrogenase subunit 6 [Acanthoparyphium sp. WAK-2018]